MITVSTTQTGSIREQNQDYLLIDSKINLAIIADGSGPDGMQAAETVSRAIWERIREVAPVTAGVENEARLAEAIEMGRSNCEPLTYGPNNVEVAALWVNRGIVAVTAGNRCAFSSSANGWQLQTQKQLTLPVQPGQFFLLCSEGLAFSPGSETSQNLSLFDFTAQVPSEETLTEKLQAFVGSVAQQYDGDDRSAILVCLEKSDITAGEPHELELFEHLNKEYSFPLWAPLAAAAGAAASGLYAFLKIRKHLPKLNIGQRH